jgi:proteasome lid subunit RPN8/RPN11
MAGRSLRPFLKLVGRGPASRAAAPTRNLHPRRGFCGAVGFLDRLRGRETDPFAPPPPPPTRRVTKIQRSVLQLILEASRSTHPNEFIAALHAEGDTVTEIVLIPAIQGPSHAMPRWNAMPTGRKIVGSVHSHPGSIPFPSEADKQFFRNFGNTHVIVAEPYRSGTWRAWDHDARPVELQVVD